MLQCGITEHVLAHEFTELAEEMSLTDGNGELCIVEEEGEHGHEGEEHGHEGEEHGHEGEELGEYHCEICHCLLAINFRINFVNYP